MNLQTTKESIETTDTFLDMDKLKLGGDLPEAQGRSENFMLAWFCMYTFVASAATAMTGPLIPGEAARHGMDQNLIGMLYFVFAWSWLGTSLFLGQLQSILGRRNVILVSFVLKIIIWVGFIVISPLKSRSLFIFWFALLNVLGGISMSSYQTASYSSLTSMFPDKVNYVVSLYETANGLGFSIGPAIGSVLFSYGGYTLPFYVFFGILLVVTLLISTLLPSFLNDTITQTVGVKEVSYISVLKNPRIFFACIIFGLNSITYDFLSPILSDAMDVHFGLSEDTVGWMFCLMGMGYVVSCQLTNITTEYVSSRRLVLIALIGNAFWLLMMGPSNMLGTHARLWVTWIGLFLGGATSAHFVVPIYSEIIEPGIYELGIDDWAINDIASGLSSTTYFLGQMVSYTAGGYMYSQAGFSTTIDSISLFIFGFAIIYFIWWDKSLFGSRDYTEDDFYRHNSVRCNSLRQPLIETII